MIEAIIWRDKCGVCLGLIRSGVKCSYFKTYPCIHNAWKQKAKNDGILTFPNSLSVPQQSTRCLSFLLCKIWILLIHNICLMEEFKHHWMGWCGSWQEKLHSLRPASTSSASPGSSAGRMQDYMEGGRLEVGNSTGKVEKKCLWRRIMDTI